MSQVPDATPTACNGNRGKLLRWEFGDHVPFRRNVITISEQQGQEVRGQGSVPSSGQIRQFSAARFTDTMTAATSDEHLDNVYPL